MYLGSLEGVGGNIRCYKLLIKWNGFKKDENYRKLFSNYFF